MLSLASSRSCILMDDELNILPTSSHVKDIRPVERAPDGSPLPAPAGPATELKELVESLADTMVRAELCFPLSPRVNAACRVYTFELQQLQWHAECRQGRSNTCKPHWWKELRHLFV